MAKVTKGEDAGSKKILKEDEPAVDLKTAEAELEQDELARFKQEKKAAEEEFGDTLWYLAAICRRMNIPLDEIFGDAAKHGKFKNACKECGTGVCEHGKFKSSCRDCGTGFCEHGCQRYSCKDCGTGLCEHGKLKQICKECSGVSICEHGKQKSRCKDCGGGSICEHGKQRTLCAECGGSQLCKHNKRISYCKECGGNSLCKSEWCEKFGNKKYEGYKTPMNYFIATLIWSNLIDQNK